MSKLRESLQILILIVVAGVLHVFSQSSTSVVPAVPAIFDGPGALKVDEVVQMGLKNNGELKAVRAELEAARARLRQAGLLLDPTLEVNRRQSNDGMDASSMWGVTIPLEVAGTRGSRIRIARMELELKEVGVKARERDLAADIRRAFFSVATRRKEAELLRKSVGFAKAGLNLTQAGVREGKVAPISESIEAVELNRMVAMLEQADAELIVAVFELRTMLGIQENDVLEVDSNLDLQTLTPVTATTAAMLSADRNLDLLGARAVEKLADARVASARAMGRPEVELMAGYEKGKNGFPFKAFGASGAVLPLEKEMTMFSFGLRLKLPILNGNRGEIRALQEELVAARNRREFGEVAVRNSTVAATMNLEKLIRSAEIMRIGVVEPSRRNIEVTRQAVDFGAMSLSEFLVLQREQIENELRYQKAVREVFAAETEYLKVIGSERLLGR